jgi:hypothetical protein
MRVATTQMPDPAMIYTDSDGEVWLVLRDGLLKPSILSILQRVLGPVLCHVAERQTKAG